MDRATLRIEITDVEPDSVTYRYSRRVSWTLVPASPNEHELLHRLNPMSGKDVQIDPPIAKESEPENNLLFMFRWWLTPPTFESLERKMTRTSVETGVGVLDAWVITETRDGVKRSESYEANTGLLIKFDITVPDQPVPDAHRVTVLRATKLSKTSYQKLDKSGEPSIREATRKPGTKQVLHS